MALPINPDPPLTITRCPVVEPFRHPPVWVVRLGRDHSHLKPACYQPLREARCVRRVPARLRGVVLAQDEDSSRTLHGCRVTAAPRSMEGVVQIRSLNDSPTRFRSVTITRCRQPSSTTPALNEEWALLE